MPEGTIYITYCSGEKDEALRSSGDAATPEELYVSARFQGFVNACRDARVEWAVLSDLHGVWFPTERRAWYDKSPEDVTEAELRALVADFDAKLAGYERLVFYHQPGRLDALYKRVVDASRLRERVEFITSTERIG